MESEYVKKSVVARGIAYALVAALAFGAGLVVGGTGATPATVV